MWKSHCSINERVVFDHFIHARYLCTKPTTLNILMTFGASITEPIHYGEIKHFNEKVPQNEKVVRKHQKLRKIRQFLHLDKIAFESKFYPQAFRKLNKNVKFTVLGRFME